MECIEAGPCTAAFVKDKGVDVILGIAIAGGIVYPLGRPIVRFRS
jgi:hypothetical protein